MSATARTGQAFLVLFGLINIVFSVSVYFTSDTEAPFPDDAKALIATWGTAMGVLVIVLATAGLRSGQAWAWSALWTAPAFLVAHVALLGTWVPDGVLAVLTVLALAATRPSERTRAAQVPMPAGR
jgi:hypothetical protein